MRTASQPRLGDAATVVREFNAAWNDHDLAAALALTSDDCVFEATSPAPDGQRHVGHAASEASPAGRRVLRSAAQTADGRSAR
jgi:ketosteroid isomerase-like protein